LAALMQRGKMAIAKVMERLEALRRTKLYDLLAAAPVIAWFAYSVAQMLPPFAQRLALLKMFVQTDPSVLPASLVFRTVSEIMTLVFFAVSIVMFTVRYVPQQGTVRLYPRLVAVAGTFLSLGFVHLPPQELSPALYLISMLLLIAGTGFAIYAIFVLGRSISLLPEARRLVTRGPYALVRHPLYLGEMVAIAGIALQHLSAWSLLLLAVAWALLFQRMKYEEQVLAQSFPEYADYMARTARLVPGVY
jgi:protein-S-isoprenylcysteine O-methyltransferase Ste14